MAGLTPDKNGSRPVPDPTVLTTLQTEKAIAAVREIFETRFEGNDKAIVLLQTQLDKIQGAIKEEVAHLQDLQNEKFEGIQLQFKERDVRVEQKATDSKTAVDAALQAQKESVTKSEIGFTKQIDQITVLIDTKAKGSDEKVDDAKTRLTALESVKKGSDTNMGFILSVIGMFTGIGALVIMVISLLLN